MIGIIGAMDEEVAELKSAMDRTGVYEQAGMSFYQGRLIGKDAVVVRSGIGKVNAGICAQILIDHFGVDTLLNTGVAGSLDARIDIGDLVFSTDVVHHDIDATDFGDPVGQVPRMDTLAFPADETLIRKAVEANAKVNPDIHSFTGRVASGDQFVADPKVKARIIRDFHALCTEMEGAGIAQTAYVNGVPFLIIRAISDKADDSATVDYPAFEAEAIRHGTRLVMQLVASL